MAGVLPAAPAAAQTAPVVAGLTPGSGPVAGGTSVTIAGSGLSGATAVTFGGVVSPLFRVENDQTIVAFSPAHAAGAVAVRVQVGDAVSSADGPTFAFGAGAWSPLADPFSPSVRSGATATLLEPPACRAASGPPGYPCGRVLVAGGAIGAAEILDPNGRDGHGTWTPTEGVGNVSRHAATLLNDGRVLIAGGRVDKFLWTDARIYDPTAKGIDGVEFPGHWLGTPPMVAPRELPTVTLLDRADCHGTEPPAAYPCGRVLVTGGADRFGDPMPDVELFDPAGGEVGSWAPTVSLTIPRSGHTATLLDDGTVLVVGGNAGGDAGGDAVASAELYDPVAGAWILLPGSMKLARTGHNAALLNRPDCHSTSPPAGYPCGRVLVTGGNGTASRDEQAEIFDPVTRAWSLTGGSAVLGPSAHSLAALADGTVLALSRLVGPAAALFDPVKGFWSLADGLPLGSDTAQSTVTALGDGRAVATNVTNGGRSTAYLFAPSTSPVPAIESIEPAAGAPTGGTKVTVRGRNLFGAPTPGQTGTTTTVRFGDATAAEVEFVSDKELVATSPSHALGQVMVTARTPVGTSSPVGAALFTYLSEGTWTSTGSLDACSPPAPSDPIRSCSPRAKHEMVRLDPPACRGDAVPADYPCGSVLTVSRSRNTVVDAEMTVGSRIVTSASARFTEDDVGTAITMRPQSVGVAPGTLVARRVDASTVELTLPVPVKSADVTGHFTGLEIALSANTAEHFDPSTGAWQATGAMVDRGTGSELGVDLAPSVTLLPDGKVLAAGGCCVGPKSEALAAAQLYDPISNTWQATDPMPSGRVGHSATLLDRPDCAGPIAPADGYPCGQVLVAGGRPNLRDEVQASPGSALLYDPLSGRWTEAGAMDEFRYLHTATLLDTGDVLAVGGFGEERPVGTAELYHPATREWSPVAPAPGAKILHSATLLDRPDCHGPTPPANYPCGKVLVAGTAVGYVEVIFRPQSGAVASTVANLFDPTTGLWTGTSVASGGNPDPMTVGRAAHSATLLPDGEVLVAGGYGPGSSGAAAGRATAEIFDPVTSRWRPVTSMRGARADHGATVLEGKGCAALCGHVLVAGGQDEAGYSNGPQVPALATAEVFTPAPAVSSLSPGTGPSKGGAEVTVHGTSLDGATQVRFGGVPATVTSTTSGAMTVISPEHQAGAVEVEIVTPAGTSAVRSEADRRTYTYEISRPPGAVGALSADAVSSTAIRVRLGAANGDGPFGPPARRYQVKVAAEPIADEASFVAARSLCDGECTFVPLAVGAPLSIDVGDLVPAATYHFAARAVNEIGVGPLSNSASATTVAGPDATGKCTEPPAPGRGQIVYPAGYSLVGLPQGSIVGAGAAVYSWFDKAGGSTYLSHGAGDALTGGHGYWTWFPCPRVVSMAAPPPVMSSLALGAYHASMVGNPTSARVSVSGFDWAARWDPALNAGSGGYHLSQYREAQMIDPGQGIWVFSYTDTNIAFTAL